MPKPYPPEFRRRALDLVASGRTVVEVAASLGIAQSALYRWRSQELIDTGRKAGTSRAESEELKAARRRIRDLEEEVKILRRAAAAVEQVVPPKGRFGIVAQLVAEGVRVKRACAALGVSKAGYYDWVARAPSARSIRHAWLTDVIGCVHAASGGVYGVPRVHAELVHAHGLVIGHNTVSLLMRRAGLHGLPTRKTRRARVFPPTSADLVDRQFTRGGPNQLWVTDITEHPTVEASSTAASYSIPTPAASSDGPSTLTPPPPWPPTR